MMHSPLALLLAGCTPATDPPSDEAPVETGDSGAPDATPTGETGGGGDLDCTDGVWLPGAFWELDTTVPVAPARAVTDLVIDAGAVPVVLSSRVDAAGQPDGVVIDWRSPGEPADTLQHSLDWGSVFGTAWGRALGLADDGRFLVGGHVVLEDGRTQPIVAAIDRGNSASVVLFDSTVEAGTVTAGPVRAGGDTWWLGTVGTGPGSAVVVWRVEGDAGGSEEVLRIAEVPAKDPDGRMVPGALAATSDGRVLVGGGTVAGDGSRAFLLLGGASGFTEVLSLPASDTGGVAGTISAAAVAGERLVYAWSAVDPSRDEVAGPSWRVYDGALTDPAGAALVDEDTDSENAGPRSIAVHPSGALLVGGSWVRAAGEVPAPYLRLGYEGEFSTTFAAPGPEPGWIDAVTVDETGEVWALCVYEQADGLSTGVELLRLECQL